jgi:serine/threonine-protein kinase
MGHSSTSARVCAKKSCIGSHRSSASEWWRGDANGRETSMPARAAVLVSGSVRSAAETLRVTAHLIDGASGCYLWSHSTDASRRDPLGIQEQVAQAIADRLPEFAAPDAERATDNLAAHNLYRQGRYHLDQRTEEGLLKALEFFERALEEDSRHAAAMSGLADAYSLLTHYGVRPRPDVWARAASAAATAVMLDDRSAEAHTSLAHAKSTQDWDWTGAEREFQRAVALESEVRDGTPLVRDVVPGASGAAR